MPFSLSRYFCFLIFFFEPFFIPHHLLSSSTLFPRSLLVCLELQEMKLTCKEETSIHRGFYHSRLISFYLLSGLSVSLHVKDMRWVCTCACMCVALRFVSAIQAAVQMSRYLTFFTWLYLTYA